MTINARSDSNVKRKSPTRSLELRVKIKELCLLDKTPIEICKILQKPRQTIYAHIQRMLEDGDLGRNQTTYAKAGPIEERRRYKIIERTSQELTFYDRQRLVPSARKMGYRLIELSVEAKSKGIANLTELGLPDIPNINDPLYKKAKKLFFDKFYRDSAEARRGVDSTYKKEGRFPKLPIDCFRDDNREPVIDTAAWGPTEPTPDRPPYDPFEITDDAIIECKHAITDYDGKCHKGQEGRPCGRWYKQPIYCEVWCESEAIQADLVKFQHGRHVCVVACKGFSSVPSAYESCKRLKETADRYDWIEKIVILYFGDSDKAGNHIKRNIENILKWYSGRSKDLTIPIPVELRLVAITPEQVKKYKLTGYQLEAFLTTEARLKIFKKILLDAIDNCWNKKIFDENCPDKEYDYDKNEIEKPEDIDADLVGIDVNYELTIREQMANMVTDAFKEGWLNENDNEV